MLLLLLAAQASTLGYYRSPAISDRQIVFTAEGDLWSVGMEGGEARRLTTHHGMELHAAFSPDGETLAFSAEYDGPTEVYTMPAGGGIPSRLTFHGSSATVRGYLDDEVLYSTRAFSGLPNAQLATVSDKGITPLPLYQADDAVRVGDQLVFTRLDFQGSSTKRYEGGNVQNLWRWDGQSEAEPMLKGYRGTSLSPMAWEGKVYFVSEESGSLNLWSMNPDGSQRTQLTEHTGFDVASPALAAGRIVYQLGADLWLFQIADGSTKKLDIRLTSDLEQSRERTIHRPESWLTNAALNHDGSQLTLTARGEIAVAQLEPRGRIRRITQDSEARWRGATPMGSGIVALSDKSGEYEMWMLDDGEPEQLTFDGGVIRTSPVPSPDGTHIAWADKDYTIWVLELGGEPVKIGESAMDMPGNLLWSDDSSSLVFSLMAHNQYNQLHVWDRDSGEVQALTSDRYDSWAPQFSADGNWLYFLSERRLESIVRSPWGPRQPEPYLEKGTGVFMMPVRAARSPFFPADELHQDNDEPEAKKKKGKKKKAREPIAWQPQALQQVPVDSDDFSELLVAKDHLYLIKSPLGDAGSSLHVLPIEPEPELDHLMDGVNGAALSGDRSKLLLSTNRLLVAPANGSKPEDAAVDLSSWRIRLDPVAERKQMLVDSWRLMREYFYDRNMHGTDWNEILERHLPLVERITDRDELSDLMHHMVGELSALHIFVRGGDVRRGDEWDSQGLLGGVFQPTDDGFEVAHLYPHDPDLPNTAGPLQRPESMLQVGDVITHVNEQPVALLPVIEAALVGEAGDKVRLRVKREKKTFDVLTVPLNPGEDQQLRYSAWELERRRQTERKGEGQLGYVHLRAMGGGDYSHWARDYYPVYDRAGLIIDVRHNRGGNIDSWIIEKLLRKAWFYWQGRSGEPTWNMQYAFRGHVVVLIDEHTASDGEAFAEGIKRLGIGHVIGTRTWGGEIWLSSSNRLVDNGIASAAEWGVYGPEGEWLIEGHGVEPDEVIDNLPVATAKGEDAQLDAAIRWLQKKIAEEPTDVPPPPGFPDKSGSAN